MFLQLKNDKYIDAESYGLNTWGSLSQTSLVKTDEGRWYIETNYCIDTINDIWEKDCEPLEVIAKLAALPKDIILVNQEEYDTLQVWKQHWSSQNKGGIF